MKDVDFGEASGDGSEEEAKLDRNGSNSMMSTNVQILFYILWSIV